MSDELILPDFDAWVSNPFVSAYSEIWLGLSENQREECRRAALLRLHRLCFAALEAASIKIGFEFGLSLDLVLNPGFGHRAFEMRKCMMIIEDEWGGFPALDVVVSSLDVMCLGVGSESLDQHEISSLSAGIPLLRSIEFIQAVNSGGIAPQEADPLPGFYSSFERECDQHCIWLAKSSCGMETINKIRDYSLRAGAVFDCLLDDVSWGVKSMCPEGFEWSVMVPKIEQDLSWLSGSA